MQNPLKLVDRRSLIVMIGAFILLTLIAVIVIVLLMSSQNNDAAQAEADQRRNEHQALTNSTSFGMEDYYLDTRNPDAGNVYPARNRKSSWTREEVNEFWIDPAEAGLETLSSDNDKIIFDSLGITGSGE